VVEKKHIRQLMRRQLMRRLERRRMATADPRCTVCHGRGAQCPCTKGLSARIGRGRDGEFIYWTDDAA
jgi:hypothetical protein